MDSLGWWLPRGDALMQAASPPPGACTGYQSAWSVVLKLSLHSGCFSRMFRHQWRCWPRAINWPVLFASPIAPSPVRPHSSVYSFSHRSNAFQRPLSQMDCHSGSLSVTPHLPGPLFSCTHGGYSLSHGIWGPSLPHSWLPSFLSHDIFLEFLLFSTKMGNGMWISALGGSIFLPMGTLKFGSYPSSGCDISMAFYLN